MGGEQSIMEILWAQGEYSVKEIIEKLSTDKSSPYVTLQTMCRILATFAWLHRTDAQWAQKHAGNGLI